MNINLKFLNNVITNKIKQSPTKLIRNVNFNFFLPIKVNFMETLSGAIYFLHFLFLKIAVSPLKKSTNIDFFATKSNKKPNILVKNRLKCTSLVVVMLKLGLRKKVDF